MRVRFCFYNDVRAHTLACQQPCWRCRTTLKTEACSRRQLMGLPAVTLSHCQGRTALCVCKSHPTARSLAEPCTLQTQLPLIVEGVLTNKPCGMPRSWMVTGTNMRKGSTTGSVCRLQAGKACFLHAAARSQGDDSHIVVRLGACARGCACFLHDPCSTHLTRWQLE